MKMSITNADSLITEFVTLAEADLARVTEVSIQGIDLGLELTKLHDNEGECTQMYATVEGSQLFTMKVADTDTRIAHLLALVSYTLTKCPQLKALTLDNCNMGRVDNGLEMLAIDLSSSCRELTYCQLSHDDFSSEGGIDFAEVPDYFSRLDKLSCLDLTDTDLFSRPKTLSKDAWLNFYDHIQMFVTAIESLEGLTELRLDYDGLQRVIDFFNAFLQNAAAPTEAATHDENHFNEETRVILEALSQLMERQTERSLPKAKRRRPLEGMEYPFGSFMSHNQSFMPLLPPPPVFLTGEALTGTCVFELERIAGDGHCGFTAMKVTRTAMADFLSDHAEKPDVIVRFKAVLLECLSIGCHDLHLDVQTQEELLRAVMTEVLSEEAFNATPSVEGRIKLLRDTARADEADFLQAVFDAKLAAEAALDASLNDPRLFRAYIELLRRELWLDTESIRFYAEMHGFNVSIWQADPAGKLALQPQHSYQTAASTETLHLLYDGQHFDRLQLQPTVLQEQTRQDMLSPLSELCKAAEDIFDQTGPRSALG